MYYILQMPTPILWAILRGVGRNASAPVGHHAEQSTQRASSAINPTANKWDQPWQCSDSAIGRGGRASRGAVQRTSLGGHRGGLWARLHSGHHHHLHSMQLRTVCISIIKILLTLNSSNCTQQARKTFKCSRAKMAKSNRKNQNFIKIIKKSNFLYSIINK